MLTINAWNAFSQTSPSAATIWMERLRAVDSKQVQQVIDQVPPQRMSQTARDFTRELLLENRRRLLAGEP